MPGGVSGEVLDTHWLLEVSMVVVAAGVVVSSRTRLVSFQRWAASPAGTRYTSAAIFHTSTASRHRRIERNLLSCSRVLSRELFLVAASVVEAVGFLGIKLHIDAVRIPRLRRIFHWLLRLFCPGYC